MKKKTQKQPKNNILENDKVLLSGWFVQALVILNGLFLSAMAFILVMLFIQGMIKDEYKRSSDAAVDIFSDNIIQLENAIRIVSGILLLSDNPYRENMPEQIRRNVSGLSAFDQVLWLYEGRPGQWQYRMIFEKAREQETKDDYKLLPSQALIAKIVKEKVFYNDKLQVRLDLPGMIFGATKKNQQEKLSPFAIIKVVEKGNPQKGVLVGVSRPNFLMDESWINRTGQVGRLSIRHAETAQSIYDLNNLYSGHDKIDFNQEYKFFIGDTEWKVTLDFIQKDNIAVLLAIPYVIVLFGLMLTVVGALFVRNNQNQSRKLAVMNKILEQSNFDLQNEVAERERLNKTLEKTSRDNRSIIDSVSDVIFETDTDGKILFLSSAWRKITGFNPEHSRENSLFSMLHPDDQDKQKEDFELLVSGHKSGYRHFSRIRTSEGTFRAVEIAISMIRQDESKNLRVVGTITDVEERRRAERALAEAEKKYRAIVENAAGGLYQITPEGMYLSVNPAMARILGYSSVEDMLRLVKNVNGVVYPDIQERNRFLLELTTAGQVLGHETEVQRKDGKIIWISENVRVVRDEQQNILYFEGSMEDITKRKEADVALLEAKMQSDIASRTKTEFIANMSHELRTPLNAIIGFSEIMKDQIMGPLGQDLYVEYAKDINKSGHGLLTIISEILDIAKIESGKRDLREREFDLSKILSSVLDMQGSKLREKSIILTNNVKDSPSLVGEETAIKQVIGNIYSNAIKFTPQGGRITLLSEYTVDGGFRITVVDSGIGMTQKEIKTALSPFGQVENRHDRAGSGTGLGLPLAKSMMELHGGAIDVTSEKGAGTTVTITFPAKRIVRKADTKAKV